MTDSHEPPFSERPRVPSLESVAARWERGSTVGMLGYIQQLVREHAAELARISDNLDHLHSDLVAVREVLRVPRPECYPDVERKRGARRRRRTPPAEGPAEPPIE